MASPRRRFTTFSFTGYEVHPVGRTVELHYALDRRIRFTERLRFPDNLHHTFKDVGRSVPGGFSLGRSPAFDAALFALHLIGGVSYYKTFCPPRLVVRSGRLTKDQANFWTTVYENGLGEFFYQNEMDFRGRVRFPNGARALRRTRDARLGAPRSSRPPRVLIPIGGGKDSLVAAELCRRAGLDVTLFRIGRHPVIEKLAAKLRLPLLTAERELSPVLFRLNERGAYNGHVPFTAYVSAAAVVVAVREGMDAVVMSNERSASVGNVTVLGRTINHQWSKGLVFERAFRQYVRRFVTPDLEYFSLLRPLSELHIARFFATMPSLHATFTSCNENWKILGPRLQQRWCGRCANCAFAFALHAAFWPRAKLLRTFGANVFDDARLLPTYRQLLGIEGIKPFACVGTAEETRAAFWLSYRRGEWNGTLAMELFAKQVLPRLRTPQAMVQEALTPASVRTLPPRFRRVLAPLIARESSL
jgi:hypothetical protein